MGVGMRHGFVLAPIFSPPSSIFENERVCIYYENELCKNWGSCAPGRGIIVRKGNFATKYGREGCVISCEYTQSFDSLLQQQVFFLLLTF